MMWFATILCVLASGAAFAWGVPLARLFEVFQPLTVALSIMLAALLVRLNRGMPTLDWKNVDTDRRSRLTAAIVALTKEYVIIVGVNAILLAAMISLLGLGKTELQSWPSRAMQLVSGLFGLFLALCIARMMYVVWRDFDIVRLQKAAIDASAKVEDREAQTGMAAEKIGNIQAAGLKNVSSNPARPLPDQQY